VAQLPEFRNRLERARQLETELETRLVGLLQRSAGKWQAVEGLVEGRMSLLEAAARFRDLDRQPPDFHWDAFRNSMPGDSDDERHCREVIGFIETRLPPRERTDLIARLEAELQAHRQQGTLRLPETARDF
jgi:hypothetical protein